MKKSRFTEQQIVAIQPQTESGVAIKDLYLFHTLDVVRQITERWLVRYNDTSPTMHSAG